VSISFIAGDAFPVSCAVTLPGSDCDSEFTAWNTCRQLGRRDAFEHKTSGIREMKRTESGDDEDKKTGSE
jgi:hypothetical protein